CWPTCSATCVAPARRPPASHEPPGRHERPDMTAAGIGFAAVILMVFLRIPIAFAMGIVGTVGFALLNYWGPALYLVGQTARSTADSSDSLVVPLFVVMGIFVALSGVSTELYAASHAFLGLRRGGRAMATVVACGGFSAICGSSLATA